MTSSSAELKHREDVRERMRRRSATSPDAGKNSSIVQGDQTREAIRERMRARSRSKGDSSDWDQVEKSEADGSSGDEGPHSGKVDDEPVLVEKVKGEQSNDGEWDAVDPDTIDNVGELVELCWMCDKSYTPDTRGKDGSLSDEIFEDVEGGGHFYAYLDHEKSTQYIAIRGTAELHDILIDLEFEKEFTGLFGPDVLLHRGFCSLASNLVSEVEGLVHAEYSTILTGHSMGGALAMILAFYLHSEGFNIEKVVTFGQPKFTDERGANILRKGQTGMDVLRIVHEHDPVPLLPPAMTQHGYSHIGRELVVNDNGLVALADRSEQMEKADSFWRNAIHSHLKDHHLEAYHKTLKLLESRMS